MNLNQGFPQSTLQLVDANGNIKQPWLQFLITLWNRTGGAVGTSTGDAETQLDLSDTDIDPVALDQATLKALMLADESGSGSGGGITGPSSTTVGDLATWANTNGTKLADKSLDAGTGITIASTSSSITISATGSASNGMLPLVTGEIPGPVLIGDGTGQCIGVPL